MSQSGHAITEVRPQQAASPTLWARLIAPPQFQDAQDTRWASMLNAIVLTVFAGYGAALMIGVPFLFANKPAATLAIAAVLLSAGFAALCLRRPHLMRTGGAVLAATLGVVPAVVLLLGSSNNAAVFIAPVLVVVVLFGPIWGFVTAVLSATVSVFIILAPELHLQLPRVFPSPPVGQAFVFVLQLALAIVPVQIILRRMGEALHRAETEASSLEHVQQSLQQSENRYRAVIGAMAEGMIVRDMDGKLLICNPAAERIIGLKASQMGHDTFPVEGWRTIHEDGTPFPREDHPVMRTRRTGEPHSDVVMGVLRPGGTLRWISINSMMLQDADGATPQGVMTTFFDITESKLAALALRESEEKFSKVFRSNPAFIAVSTLAEGRYIDVNGAYERVTGYTREQVVGKTVSDIRFWVNPEERAAMVETMRRDHRVQGLQAQIYKASGEIITCDISAELIDIGGVQCMISNTTDITERRRAEEAVQRLNTELENRVSERTLELEAANKDLEAFSATVSHDLRAPLRHIGGYLELLRDNLGPDLAGDNQRYLQSATRASARMTKLIEDLLEFSRLGRASLKKGDIELDALVRDAMHSLEPDTRGRDIRWIVHPLPRVHADASLLHQVLVNLLSNAVKYTRPVAHAVIEIGALDQPQPAGHLVVYVRDNGVGFNMQHADKLFGVFQRLHSASEFEGTGIGLANVGNIVQRHGGRAWIEAAENKGATAYIALPALH
jgi:PAS domain S-box-containing protein